jgi:DNA-binding response OmpR family regulator
VKILIIDDNKSITDSIEKYLTIKGHDVRVCNDGHEGLEHIQNDKWDKILLDLSMPEVSGLDIIESLEGNNAMKDKNIIVFTAASIPEYIIEKLLAKEGIQGLLKKPLSIVHLSEALTA